MSLLQVLFFYSEKATSFRNNTEKFDIKGARSDPIGIPILKMFYRKTIYDFLNF